MGRESEKLGHSPRVAKTFKAPLLGLGPDQRHGEWAVGYPHIYNKTQAFCSIELVYTLVDACDQRNQSFQTTKEPKAGG